MAKYTMVQIADLYEKMLGRQPTERELVGWGNDIDNAYYLKIVHTLGQTQEAKDYAANSTKKRLTEVYQRLVGRDPTAGELANIGTNVDDQYFNTIATNLAGTQEAKDFEARGGAGATNNATTNATTTATGGGSDKERIDAMLREVQSTDDPAYWYKIAADHGGLDATGVDWMRDRINRGDGSMLVKNGTLQKFQDNGGGEADYLKPWDQQYEPPPYTPPPAFEAPDPSKIFDDPSFKSRMNAGLNALERSAAARGTLLTGGTLADEQQYGQDMATQEYDKVYSRAANEDQVKYGRSQAEYGIARDNALAKYNDRQGTFMANEDRPFSKLLSYGQMGMGALNSATSANLGYVGGYNNAMFNGTNAVNNNTTAAANATASGGVGAANAQSQAWRDMVSTWSTLYGRRSA